MFGRCSLIDITIVVVFFVGFRSPSLPLTSATRQIVVGGAIRPKSIKAPKKTAARGKTLKVKAAQQKARPKAPLAMKKPLKARKVLKER